MRIITAITFTVFTAFCVGGTATAVTVTNTDKCIVTPCVGTDCQNHAVNSVSSQCTSKTYTVVKHVYDTSADSGKEYGTYTDCSACPSGYYVSDTKASIAHNVCGTIQYYNTCAQASTCRGTPPTPAAASTVSNCSSASKVTFGKTTYYTCNTCNSDYTRTAVTVSDERCTNTTTKYICEKSTATSCDPAKCIPDPAWTCGAANSPVPKEGVCIRNYRSCNNDTCVVSTFWQCKSGYYGSPDDTSHSCAKCPQPSDGAVVGTKNTDYDMPTNTHTTIDDCYVTGGTDATGRYLYTSKTSDSPYQCAYGTN